MQLCGAAPRVALLHACHTGGAAGGDHLEPVELPAAWLSAGSEAVVGCDGPLPDALSAPLTAALAAALGEGLPIGEAVHRGIRALRGAPAAAWSGLRLWGDPRLRLGPPGDPRA